VHVIDRVVAASITSAGMWLMHYMLCIALCCPKPVVCSVAGLLQWLHAKLCTPGQLECRNVLDA